MADREFDRERRWWRDRDYERDWDWDEDYYEYSYSPYSPYRRSYFGRDYGYEYQPYPYGDWTRGRYTGVGPRGYRRSDERIAEDVNDRLTWHGQIDASDIEVDVNDGIVTLTGTVNSRREKRMAENIAEGVSGVWDVNNRLNIRNASWNRGGMSGQIREGMEVIGRDGEHVGQVKEVRSNDFLVDRPMARDVYVPLRATNTTDGRIRLNIRADEVDNQGWPVPELLET